MQTALRPTGTVQPGGRTDKLPHLLAALDTGEQAEP